MPKTSAAKLAGLPRERRKLAELKAAPYNPRRISEKALAGLMDSISRFGQVQDVIVNVRSGFVVGGHQRVVAMQRLGHTECDVVLVDLDETAEKALNVALNNQHIAGEFDDSLASLLEGIRAVDPDVFSELRFDALMPRAAAPEPEEEKPAKIDFLVFAHQRPIIDHAMELLRAEVGPTLGKRGEKIRNGEILTRLCQAYLDADR